MGSKIGPQEEKRQKSGAGGSWFPQVIVLSWKGLEMVPQPWFDLRPLWAIPLALPKWKAGLSLPRVLILTNMHLVPGVAVSQERASLSPLPLQHISH